MKKLNKFFAVLVALAMMATLCVCMAFAAPQPASSDDGTLVTDITDVVITKNLVVPEGVTAPTITSTFNFVLDTDSSVGLTNDEKDTTKAAYTALAIDDKTVTQTGVVGSTKTDTVPMAAADLPTFAHPGVYAYTVSETTAPTITSPVAADLNNEIEKDNGSYTVRFYVEAVKNGETTSYVATKMTVNKNSATATDEGKVSPTEGFEFTNVYKVTNGEEQPPEGPIDLDKVALAVSKAVTGEAPATDTFPMTITLTAANGQELSDIEAYIYNINDVEDPEVASANDSRASETKYTPNDQGVISVELKANQALAFLQLPAGTKYQVSETLASDAKYAVYTPSYAATVNAAPYSGNEGAGMTLTTGNYLLQEKAKDKVAYTNVYDNSINTPTGILMNNLPYIALALVAIGGLVAYVVVRRRQDDEA